MKVLAFIFVTTLLVLGTISEDPDVTTTEVSTSADEVTTELGTPEGEAESDTVDETTGTSLFCYVMVATLKVRGYLENGMLNESKAEETVDLLDRFGRRGLILERAGNCTEEANLETGDCEVITTFARCLQGNKNGTETVAHNED